MEGSTSSTLTLGCVLGNSPPSDVALAVILVRVVAMTTAIISPTSTVYPRQGPSRNAPQQQSPLEQRPQHEHHPFPQWGLHWIYNRITSV